VEAPSISSTWKLPAAATGARDTVERVALVVVVTVEEVEPIVAVVGGVLVVGTTVVER
jgi:hypothetical protein